MAPHPSFRPGSIDPLPARRDAEPPRPLVDHGAITAVTELYREMLPARGAILDLMSGWMSHLPPEICYARVVGVGPDGEELAQNPFLDEWRVQDLNREPRLPFADGEFDGAAMCAALHHMTRPGEVIREVGRVLKPGAPLVVSLSSRFVQRPGIACWRLLDDTGHLCLLAHHFAEAGNWTDVRCLDRTPPGGGAPLYAVIGRSLGAADAD